MAHPQEIQIRTFYKSISGKNALPVEPDSPAYLPILEDNPQKDPILKMRARILFEDDESVHLLTGYRGNGKSTQLRRLKKLLEEGGCRVFLIDMLEYIVLSQPLELSDFLLSLMAGLAQTVEADSKLKALTETYWEKLKGLLPTKVDSDGLKLGADLGIKGTPLSASIGLMLKTDPNFKRQLQAHLKGHLTTLVKDARAYVVGLVDVLRADARDDELKVVVLVDSLEQLRGWGEEGKKVYESVASLFTDQSANLKFEKIHIVYTVPPYLQILAPNVSNNLGGDPIAAWPNVHVRKESGEPDKEGLRVMEHLIQRRYPAWSSFISESQLHRLAGASGGDIRDFFRLVRETLISLTNTVPAASSISDDIVEQSEQQLRNELAILPDDDAKWLWKVHQQHDMALTSIDDVPSLIRFLDSNLIMNYLNGKPWYDVHPLILDTLEKRINK